VNQGVIKARNVGLRLATKDYMVCLDNDQIVRSNWLVRLRREMALGYDFVGVEAWEMSARHLHPKKRHIIKRSGIKIDYVGAGGCLMKRSVLEDIGIFDERFGMAYYEDPDLCYRAKEAGYKIGWYHRPIINHLEHQTLIHGQKDFKHNDELSSSHAFFKEKVANKIKGQIYTECSLYEDVESVIEDVPCHNGMITLCMAVKNRSSRAYKSIQSIVNEETLRYFNFVIVEDISSDMLDLKAFKYRDKINHYIVDTDGPWNKSKLLNYGFKRHVGEYASVWDADFVFPKEFLSKYLKTLNNIDFSKKYLRIKCTETHNTERRGVKFNKGDLYGGFFTFSYDQFVGVRGYDERFTKWGFEDLDFNKRICGKYGALEHVVSERGLVYHFSHDDMRDMANLNFNEKMMNDNINNKNYIVNPNEFGEIEKGINRSDTLVVMCNGPSLREVDFNDLNGYDTFGMNGAYRYYYEHNWWPTYFGCFDFLVTESHKKSYVNMMTDKGIPIKEYFLLSKISNSKKLKTLDINGDLYSFSDRLSTFGNGGNTGSNCCQVGICLGYKRIILLGADCNYKEVVDGASKKSNYLVMDETPESNPNYFFDSYQRSGDAYNFPQSAKFHMPAWESLARFAESKGVDIVNCSRESKLECFRKADLKDEILINEKVNVDVAVDKKIKILMYTDSRGDNISADKNYDHFGVRLSEIYDVDMHLCTEKWTTTLDFLKLTKSVDMSKYDCVILYTGIVEWSPRLQESALNDLYRGRKGIAGKRDMFDMVFGKNDAESYLKTCLADNYEGKPSNNMYSTRMLRDSLLPALNKIDNLIWISGNKINTEWRGNYWKDRPVNMPITELYSNILSSKLDYVIDNMEWSYDDVQKYTFDNIHPNKLGSDIIYNKIIDKIGFIDSIGGFK
jgi:GT2 family glycosyltransferase